MSDNRRQLFTYLILVFGLTYGVIFSLNAAGVAYGSNACMAAFIVCMFLPTLCSLLTRLLTKEGWKDMYLAPNFAGHKRYYLAAWLLPGALILLGTGVFFLFYPGRFDPQMNDLKAMLPAEQAQSLTLNVFWLQAGQALLISSFVNLLPCLGEELGWRGYMLPKLLKETSPRKAILLSGLIWGLWHAPMIAMGHNYGIGYAGAPWLGILAMIGFCEVLGSILAWLTMRTRSAIPAAMAHGAVNGIAGVGLLIASGANPFIGPAATGILGGSGLLVMGVIAFVLAGKKAQA